MAPDIRRDTEIEQGLLPALLAAWPNLRSIARIDLGRAVRERTR